MYRKVGKRILDLGASFFFILLLSPIYLLVSLLVFVFLGHPVIFKQERPGYQGRLFNIYKFRTMLNEYNDNGELVSDEKRLTSFGRFLRSTSLDELPEIFNVLLGQMSLVGPRPLLVEYLPLYSKEQNRRHHVRPGLTGLAQVNGRNAISWKERLDYDVFYVDHVSLWLDIKIVVKTILVVLHRRGVEYQGIVIDGKFKGNNHEEK
jgi:lipopolysaccharide/colanic/teichoic acid biosynthesis glycosyltransferase